MKLMRWIYPALQDKLSLRLMRACLILFMGVTLILIGSVAAMSLHLISANVGGLLIRGDLFLIFAEITIAFTLAELDLLQDGGL